MRRMLAFLACLTIGVTLISELAWAQDDPLKRPSKNKESKGYFYIDLIGGSLGAPSFFEGHLLQAAIGYGPVLLGTSVQEIWFLPGGSWEHDIIGNTPFYLHFVPYYKRREGGKPYLVHFYAGGSSWCKHREVIESEQWWEEEEEREYKAQYLNIGIAAVSASVFEIWGGDFDGIVKVNVGYLKGSIDGDSYYPGVSLSQFYGSIGVGLGWVGSITYPW